MMCLAIPLVASTVMEGHQAWEQSWSYEAQCLFNDLKGNVSGGSAFWITFDLFFIVTSYASCILTLWERPARKMEDLLITWLIDRPKNAIMKPIRVIEAINKLLKKAKAAGRSDTYFRCLIHHCSRWGCLMALVILRILLVAALLPGEVLSSRTASNLLNILWFICGVWGIFFR